MKASRWWIAPLCSFAMAVFAAGSVDLNSADATALAEGLDGIGLKKAEAIVAYRTEHGPFTSVDDLLNVDGIGEKTVAANRDQITLGAKPTSKAKAKTPAQ